MGGGGVSRRVFGGDRHKRHVVKTLFFFKKKTLKLEFLNFFIKISLIFFSKRSWLAVDGPSVETHPNIYRVFTGFFFEKQLSNDPSNRVEEKKNEA